MKWAIITGEYPPQPGGVSDYTQILARALAAAGDEVHVWAPACDSDMAEASGIVVHRLTDAFGRASLARMGREIDALSQPCRILVQYVPHSFGWKAMNLPFCLWLSRRGIPVWVMFHEVVFPLRWLQLPSHQLLGIVTRIMAAVVIRSSERVFVSTPAWNKFIQGYGRADSLPVWLPVPSNVNTIVDSQRVASLRSNLLGEDGVLIGHFGTYSQDSRFTMQAMISDLLAPDSRRSFMLLGRNSQAFAQQVEAVTPALKGRIIAPGELSSEDLSLHLAACDVVVQPYPDGITTRRGSSMAPLALGVPIVTNLGFLSEPLWRESGAVALTKNDSSQAFVEATEELLLCREKIATLRLRASLLYASRFSIQCTLNTIRDSA